MILRTTGQDVAEQARTGNYVGTSYEKMDCQMFVETVLKDLGVRKPTGKAYNWRGSNSMFRNYILWRGTIDECRKKFGKIPEGAFLFLVKKDGGEIEKGYNDGLGNASHVGLYVRPDSDKPCMDSQPTGGVQYRKLSVFTHVGLMGMIDYSTAPEPPANPNNDEALKAVNIIRRNTSSDSEWLDALKTLTKYVKEDNI